MPAFVHRSKHSVDMTKDDDGASKVIGPTRDFGFLPIPHSCRYDPDRPPRFTLALNILFGLGSTVTVALLYYCQPLLVVLAQSFDVSYDEVARVPTLTQAGALLSLPALT